MSSAEKVQAHLQPQTPSFAMLRTLGGVAMLSGLLVVLAFQFTKPIIEENKRIAIEKAVSHVIPGVVSKKDFLLSAEGLFPADGDKTAKGEKIYAAYGANGELKGIALEAAATGYQDVIRILYGYNQDCQCVTGIKILKMAETPGLGDKIAFDPDFLKNFEALDARLNGQKSGLENAIVTVKHGSKREQWQIDSISGATISSKAIGRMINESGQRMFPLIIKHLDALRIGQKG
ncbi:MAG: FMN-binding protein [Sedimenticola sp.]|uniref:Ion-translocating oxidoreductase complex subunit G n=1 Tax=Sedimenticola thiotaurini TaxID=1543721 RepID=A0A558CVQ2_9GAMM|nr:FMN-binding protein [Sedimenticola sp.]MCW8949623.1 FMN-binding protein [Sedimenticola sp.]MCW8974782.1 FMN-binding protein [Sedimenticola sp.]MDF1527537.1 FMN-binding protein [Sedimenticola sp.]TVT52822.1 MAG: FMN-binding protein [Sedimenticola thiotaurini]